MNKTVAILPLAGALLAVGATSAGACMAFSPPGGRVQFGDQNNIIVWNPKTHTEHFIRIANFDTKAKDFAFIAPTPTKPTLRAVSENAYDDLMAFAPRPRMVEDAAGRAPMAARSSAPKVIQEKNVGAYHAVTLKASNNAGLTAYLKQNGYASTSDTSEWTKYYVNKGWMLTAFKIRKGVDLGSVPASLSAVRMSFKTDAPFNPYRVPKSNAGSGKLTVLFLSDQKYSAFVGDTDWQKPAWEADASSAVRGLAAHLHLPASDIPAAAHLTTFVQEDWTKTASLHDISFAPSKADAMLLGRSQGLLASTN